MGNANHHAPSLDLATWQMQHNNLAFLQQRLNGISEQLTEREKREQTNRPDLEPELLNLLGDTMMAMLEHFLWEESQMKALPEIGIYQDHCKRHKQEHADASEQLSALIRRQGELSLPESITALNQILNHWMTSHQHDYDEQLAKMLIDRQS